jgi:hypothetical protein
VLSWLAREGVVNFCLDPADTDWLAQQQKELWRPPYRVLFVNQEVRPLRVTTELPARDLLQPFPTALVFAPTGPTLTREWRWLETAESLPGTFPLVLVLPLETPDLARPDRQLRRVLRNVRTLDDLNREFGV